MLRGRRGGTSHAPPSPWSWTGHRTTYSHPRLNKSKPLAFLCFAKVEQLQFTVIVDTKTVMGNQIVLAYIPFQEVLEKNSL